jgi:hypothetical protein
VEGVSGYVDTADDFVIDLAEGERISLAARSTWGDMDVYVLPPGATLSDMRGFYDGGGGMYGLDAAGTFTADAAGTYVIAVSTYDRMITGYRFSVE